MFIEIWKWTRHYIQQSVSNAMYEGQSESTLARIAERQPTLHPSHLANQLPGIKH
jgi:hypothetical protein